ATRRERLCPSDGHARRSARAVLRVFARWCATDHARNSAPLTVSDFVGSAVRTVRFPRTTWSAVRTLRICIHGAGSAARVNAGQRTTFAAASPRILVLDGEHPECGATRRQQLSTSLRLSAALPAPWFASILKRGLQINRVHYSERARGLQKP